MMISVKGTFQNGVAQSIEAISGREGQTVIITFLEDAATVPASNDDSRWDQIMQIIEQNIVDTGIEDLSYQHDHYLYGKPKQD
jgi:hypothetical protein